MVKDYALLTNREQFEVKIISLDKCYHSANEKLLEEAGIPITYLSELRYPADKSLNIIQKVIRSLGRYYDLRRIVKKERPDILHVHLYIGNYLKCIPLKKWGIKVFYTVHNVLERFFDPSGENKEKYQAYKEIKRLLQKEELGLIALHEDMNEELKKLFVTDRVFTVNNGVNLDRFHKELYDSTAKRLELGISQESFVIGHVGRFHEQKNHEWILKVFYAVCQKKINAHLLLIGEGPLREKVDEQILCLGLEDNVTILHNRGDIPELMSAMDVFLFPSRWEGFGNVMIEAQSMGLKCVVSDKIPSNVILNDNVSVLALEESVDKWVEAVLEKDVCEVSEKITEYEIKNSVLKLQHIYLKETET